MSPKALYVTEGSESAPGLQVNKGNQRRQLADMIQGKGTILELFSGKGNLSKAVYRPHADKFVLVDADSREVNQAKKNLRGVKVEGFAADNVDWINTQMKDVDLSNLKLVDFDAFGSPPPAMKAFFARKNEMRGSSGSSRSARRELDLLNSKVGFNSHGLKVGLKEIKELELDRGNKWFNNKHLDLDKTTAIWVTDRPEDALRYGFSASLWDADPNGPKPSDTWRTE